MAGWSPRCSSIDPRNEKGRDRRPGQMALLEAIRSGTVHRVMLYSIDRVGRTLVELVGFIEMCRASSVAIIFARGASRHSSRNGMSHVRLHGNDVAPPSPVAPRTGFCVVKLLPAVPTYVLVGLLFRPQGRESQAGIGGWQGRPSCGAAYRGIASIVQPN